MSIGGAGLAATAIAEDLTDEYRQFLPCIVHWATATSSLPGWRAPRCPPTRRSPTRNAAAANANDRLAAGLTHPAERDVVRLVSEGLGNKDIGTRLFISPRTVQTHLTHVYTKLGLNSRVQLVQEAAHHA